MEQVFDGSRNGSRIMRVGMFFSGGASAYKAIRGDPNFREKYDIVVGLTNNPNASGIELLESDGIPVIQDPVRFPPFDLRAAETEYGRVLSEIAKYEADILMLSGWMRLLGYPIIEKERRDGEAIDRGKYTNRVLNVHPAFLSLVAGDNSVVDLVVYSAEEVADKFPEGIRRRYTGGNAVYDAVAAGERTVGSTIHFVDAGCDSGPILVQSKRVDVLLEVRTWIEMGRDDLVREYSKALQELMKWHCDGPAYLAALTAIANGRIALDGNTVYIDGQEMPYGGLKLR